MNKIENKINSYFSQFPSDNFEKGNILISPEEDIDYVSFIKSGYVKMYSISESGKELVLNIFKPGTYFPAIPIISSEKNYFFYEAFSDVELIKVTKENFLDFIEREKEVYKDVSKRIFKGMNSILVRMSYLLSSNAEARVAATLLMCFSRFGIKNTSGNLEIDIDLTHKDVADLSGLTREATSLQIGKLKKEGMIFNEGKRFIILDKDKLRITSRIYHKGEPVPYYF